MKRFWLKLDILAILSGILYNSWPLGYWLNPAVNKGLASELEGLHQPFNWLFISTDVISSLMIILASYYIWRHLRKSIRRSWLAAILINIVLFGIGTTLDALLPLRCSPSVQRCPSYHQDHLLLAHGLLSIGASVCLFIALLLAWWSRRRSYLLNALMVGYLLFGFFSLLEALSPTSGNWSQHYYITLCSLWIAVLPYTARQLFSQKSPNS